jgi:phage shock protein B
MIGGHFILGVIFLTFVVPLALVLKFLGKWRSQRTLSPDEQESLTTLWVSTRKMEERIRDLERVLQERRSEGD